MYVLLLFYPETSINECLMPWSYLVRETARLWIIATLPRELSTLWVRHNGEMTAILACKSSNIVCRTIRVCRVFRVVELSHYIVL